MTGRHPGGQYTDLTSTDDEDLVFDGPGPQQYLPVARPGGGGEGRRNGHHGGATQGEGPIDLRKPEVVTDGEPEDGGRVIAARW